eukprot:TRINITY_DN14560_c0_g1_i1.p1 TRINITY_DN14560_c0_g1~~TRINITY_DN14560_c0_g1_i1.p1  ORF type:complete len:141 (+),score=26.74 TRINITY_DN14560_c0_g1_i1:36-458(+)
MTVYKHTDAVSSSYTFTVKEDGTADMNFQPVAEIAQCTTNYNGGGPLEKELTAEDTKKLIELWELLQNSKSSRTTERLKGTGFFQKEGEPSFLIRAGRFQNWTACLNSLKRDGPEVSAGESPAPVYAVEGDLSDGEMPTA